MNKEQTTQIGIINLIIRATTLNSQMNRQYFVRATLDDGKTLDITPTGNFINETDEEGTLFECYIIGGHPMNEWLSLQSVTKAEIKHILD